MKKLSSVAIVAMFAALVLSSCKKDYTCSCTTTMVGLIDTTFTSSGTINDKKDDAKSKCESSNGTTTDGYGDTITVSCHIQ